MVSTSPRSAARPDGAPQSSGGRHAAAPDRRRVRRLVRLVIAAAVVVGLVWVGLAAARHGPAAPAGPAFGVLGSSCDPTRLGDERSAGVTTVEFDMGWNSYEPAQGTIDPAYVNDVRARLKACRDAGMALVLSLGLQSPPDWVTRLPGATLLDRNGNPPGQDGRLDLVFSSAVRTAVGNYFSSAAKEVGFAGVVAIRLGTGAGGELGFPGPDDGSSPGGNDFWAFNAAAQAGSGLVEGLTPSPLPGWHPGDPTWQGRPVDPHQVTAWFSWYSRSLVTAVGWQAEELRRLGFTGEFHVPVAGTGARPADLSAALAGGLDGRNDPFGALARGLDYPEQLPQLAELDRQLRAGPSGRGVAVDVTGVDDDTTVVARRQSPPQDACRPDDPDAVLTAADVARWPSFRFTLAVARHAGLAVLGENPGAPQLAGTGGSKDSDSLEQQLTRATAYARQCGLSTFLFAFERELFDRSSGVSLDDYAREIDHR